MKKIVSLLVFMGILILPLISYAASQPGQFDWRGGPHERNMVIGKTFDEILARATHEAAVFGKPIEYKTELGGLDVRAYPDSSNFKCVQEGASVVPVYPKSKLVKVHVKAWEDEGLFVNDIQWVLF
jgi:hypothetical protein